MSDFNGRIGDILHAVKKNDGDLGSLSYAIRRVLKAEREDGWHAGYSDGAEDTRLTYGPVADGLRAEIERLKGLLAKAGISEKENPDDHHD